MNEILSAFLILIGIIVISLGGMFIVRRFVSISTLESHHEVAGFIYAVVGVIYAVLLAFAVLIVWEQHNDADVKLEKETASISSIYRHISGIQNDSFRLKVILSCKEYVETMIKNEFPAMENHTTSSENERAYLRLWSLFHSYQPKTEHDKFWFGKTVDALGELQINRRLRILSIQYGVPPFVWFSLIFGGILTISFAYLFGTKKALSHTVMIFCLSGIIGTALILITALEHPFMGIVKVDPRPLYELLRVF